MPLGSHNPRASLSVECRLQGPAPHLRPHFETALPRCQAVPEELVPPQPVGGSAAAGGRAGGQGGLGSTFQQQSNKVGEEAKLQQQDACAQPLQDANSSSSQQRPASTCSLTPVRCGHRRWLWVRQSWGRPRRPPPPAAAHLPRPARPSQSEPAAHVHAIEGNTTLCPCYKLPAAGSFGPRQAQPGSQAKGLQLTETETEHSPARPAVLPAPPHSLCPHPHSERRAAAAEPRGFSGLHLRGRCAGLLPPRADMLLLQQQVHRSSPAQHRSLPSPPRSMHSQPLQRPTCLCGLDPIPSVRQRPAAARHQAVQRLAATAVPGPQGSGGRQAGAASEGWEASHCVRQVPPWQRCHRASAITMLGMLTMLGTLT